MPTLCTIGFTQTSAEHFFGLLREAGVRRVVDVRLHPGGQLSGFAKASDLAWFLRELADCDYQHDLRLAPSPELFADYRASHDAARWEAGFDALMDERDVPGVLDRAEYAAVRSCLLCSEHQPEHCHRNFVARRIAAAWPEFEIRHLT